MAAVAKVVETKPAIDTEHLARMTLGERSLEREVLELFGRQADMLLPRIRRGDPALAAASAHTLKGSAVGIGAFGVARAAEAVASSAPVVAQCGSSGSSGAGPGLVGALAGRRRLVARWRCRWC